MMVFQCDRCRRLGQKERITLMATWIRPDCAEPFKSHDVVRQGLVPFPMNLCDDCWTSIELMLAPIPEGKS